MTIQIAEANNQLAGQAPQAIIEWALAQDGKAIVTTNFSPYESVILHMATQVNPNIEILWVDSGYALRNTYKFAQKTIEQLGLNMTIFTPAITSAYQDAVLGGIPSVEEEEAHAKFTEAFKLEPFKRGLESVKPDIWLTAVRREQTAFRQDMDVISSGPNGVVKVAPLLEWTEAQMQAYIEQHDLPNELKYFDPTKALENRECGLHTQL